MIHIYIYTYVYANKQSYVYIYIDFFTYIYRYIYKYIYRLSSRNLGASVFRVQREAGIVTSRAGVEFSPALRDVASSVDSKRIYTYLYIYLSLSLQWVHVAVWYIPRSCSSSYVLPLGPMYLLYKFLDPLGYTYLYTRIHTP